MDASFEAVVNEILLAKETAGKFAQETGAELATPSVKIAGFTAGLSQLGRERLQIAGCRCRPVATFRVRSQPLPTGSASP